MNVLTTVAGLAKQSGMRKVSSGLAIFVTCAWLLSRGALPAADFTTITLVITGAIVVGNVVEHKIKAEAKKDVPAQPATPAA